MKKRFIIALILPLITSLCVDAQSIRQRLDEAMKLHRSYDFDGAEAIYDNILKEQIDSTVRESVQELRILSENGRNMLQFATRPVATSRKTVSAKDFFLYYSHLDEGKWIKSPNAFAKGGAKANYIDTSRNSIVFSAPDEDGNLALFITTAGMNGVWSEPKAVESCACSGNNIYPLVSASGEELYFSSDAMAGMGGYDLYVCRWNMRRRCWGAPENLGFPYSSTGDDFLFSNTPDGNFTIIASNRDCGMDSMTIYALEFVNSPVKQPVSSIAEARRIASLEPHKIVEAAAEMPKPVVATALSAPEMERKAALLRLETMKEEIRDLAEVRTKLIGAREISANESHMMDLQRRIGALSDTITMMDIDIVAAGKQPSFDFAAQTAQVTDEAEKKADYSYFKHNYGTLEGVTVEQPVSDMDKYAFSISDKTTILDDIPRDGIIYQIQIGVSSTKMKEKQFKGISPAFSKKQPSGKYLHCVGAFRTYEEASEALGKVKRNGFPSAYVIAFRNGTSIAVSKAKTME